jgi:hypothetical protein
MRRQQARKAARQSGGAGRSRESDVPLPLKGLFTRAKTAEMSGLFAAELRNWRSNGLFLTQRPGLSWAPGLPSPVLQRVPFEFASGSGYIELRPTEARFGPLTYVRPFNGEATYAVMSGHVILADGLANPTLFNGTAFVEGSWTTTTGVDARTFDGVVAHHERLYFWKIEGTDVEFYYGGIGEISGALTRFPLGRLGNVKGRIFKIASLTIDANNNTNDVLAIFTTTGQILIYEGLDPSFAESWALRGRVQAAPPLARNGFAQVGSDLWMLTRTGIVSVADSLGRSTLALVSTISEAIHSEIVRLVAEPGSVWSLHLVADGSMLIVNQIRDGVALQFIYYMDSKAWATADMQVRDFHGIAGVPQATGLDGRLATLQHEGSDEIISCRWVSSWFRLGRATGLAYLLPTIIAKGPLTLRVVVLSDQNGTGEDIAEAEQTITLEPEVEDGGSISLSDEIALDAVGSTYQLQLEVSSQWIQLISLQAAA